MTTTPRTQGFTLIEIIVALAVFAILSTLTASVMLQAFKTKTHLAEETERMNQLQLAVTLIRRDVEQIITRSIRGNEMRLFPPFIGEAHYTEFTRGGFVNPNSIIKSSTLKRVALLCDKNSMTRRSWTTLDGPKRQDYQDRVLLSNLASCKLSYLSQSHELLSSWQPYAVSQDQKNASIPAAIQLSLTFKHLGTLELLFPIPEGMKS